MELIKPMYLNLTQHKLPFRARARPRLLLGHDFDLKRTALALEHDITLITEVEFMGAARRVVKVKLHQRSRRCCSSYWKIKS